MQLITIDIGDIKPYEKNPRRNDEAVDAVVKSIQQCGYVAPIILDEDNVILAGHTRYKALVKLGRDEAECVVKPGLSEEQKRKYRLLDNKTNELAEWDLELLADEIADLDFGDLDLDWGFEDEEEDEEESEADNPYTTTINIPQYEPTGEQPSLLDVVDINRASTLTSIIDASSVSPEEKDFLRKAACRHYTFNYRLIAEYYASASPEMQELMEQSALVIIDYDDAIRNGYAKLSQSIQDITGGDAA